MDLKFYLPAKDAAEVIGINYPLLMSRIYNGKIPSHKVGHAVFLKKSDVKKMKKVEDKRRADARRAGVEGPTG